MVTGVYEDQLLATVHPATEGIKGYTIFNEELNAKDGQECFYEAGENVQPKAILQPSFSHSRGNAHVEGETIHVKPIVVINGDVDYETGNIDTTTDVQISGNVKADSRSSPKAPLWSPVGRIRRNRDCGWRRCRITRHCWR